jgi:hypothetical protein
LLELTYTTWDIEPFAQDCIRGLARSEIEKSEMGLDAYVRRFIPKSISPTSLPPYSLPPFKWDDDRRFLIRCELDAAFFHLYLPADEGGDWRPARTADGCPYDETAAQLAELKHHFPTPRDAVAYIMDTFPIVRRKDEDQHGEYRTKRVILEIYDAMQESMRSGRPYQTRLDPPPADPRCCHPLPEGKQARATTPPTAQRARTSSRSKEPAH